MTLNDTVDPSRSSTGGVPSNYALMFGGVFFFPVLIAAFHFANTRRFTAEEWERSHYEMQRRTIIFSFIGGVLDMTLTLGIASSIPPRIIASDAAFMIF